MKNSHIVTLNIVITLLLLGGFYYAINRYGTQFLTGVRDKNGVTKVINQKVIQQNVSEYRKLSDMQSDITKAIATVAPSTVHLVRSADVTSTLSGFVVTSIKWGATAVIATSDGYLITNKHVITNLKDKYVAITKEWQKLPVTNIRLDPVLDLAVVKVSTATGKSLTGLPAASFVSAESPLNLGQFIIALGSNSSRLDFVQSVWTISQKNILMWLLSGDLTTSLPYYGIDTPVYPGFSGGPTVDLQWNVIAITTAMQNGDTQNGYTPWGLILPVTKEMIQATLTSIKLSGKIIRTPFGMTTIPLTSYLAEQLGSKKFNGRYVQKITPGTPAAEMGLVKWDIITEIDGKSIDGDTPFARYRLGYSSGDKLNMTAFRNDERKDISITLK